MTELQISELWEVVWHTTKPRTVKIASSLPIAREEAMKFRAKHPSFLITIDYVFRKETEMIL